MPKKTTTARGGAQRSKPKTQKSFELVRPAGLETAQPLETSALEQETATPQAIETSPSRNTRSAAAIATPVEVIKEAESSTPTSAPKGSAAARLAARRQAAQRAQQRSAVALLTPEHFAYVKRDLTTIAVLAVIMFAAIIVLYFTIGRI